MLIWGLNGFHGKVGFHARRDEAATGAVSGAGWGCAPLWRLRRWNSGDLAGAWNGSPAPNGVAALLQGCLLGSGLDHHEAPHERFAIGHSRNGLTCNPIGAMAKILQCDILRYWFLRQVPALCYPQATNVPLYTK